MKHHGKSLKEASSLLKINYSTAKTILRVYRIENRILKKSSNGNLRKNTGCTCKSTDSRHEVHSTFDTPEKELRRKSSDNLNQIKNLNIVSDPNLKAISYKQPELASFSLNRSEQNIPSTLEITNREKPCEYKLEQNKFNLPKFTPTNRPSLFNQSNHINNNFFNDLIKKFQYNMLSIQNCYKKIDHNTSMINNVNYLLDKIRMNTMFS